MASILGGRADKLGNEFERLWTVRHLLELISGRALSVRIECLGDDEKGTEFWVDRPDATREAHQCKRENASEGLWSVADLANKNIISAAKFQLDRDPRHRFVFASGDKAPHLADLCERSRSCASPAEFRSHAVTTSQPLEREFQNLCRYLGLDAGLPAELDGIYDFLRRFTPRVADKLYLHAEVEDLAARYLTGDPKHAVAALKNFADNNIGRTLLPGDVIAALPDSVRPRDLSQDPALHASLENLRERFDRSYRHLLIGGMVLDRRETHELLSLLNAEDGPRLILLHGPGGAGKSGVVYELAQQLGAERIPYMPVRLDRDRTKDSPREFGSGLGLPASPAACLAAAAAGRPAVLLLDQVDAIRWTAAHSGYAWETCESVISEALSQRNLRVVVVCRTFDVEDNPQIRAWRNSAKAHELKVGPIDDAKVDAIVAACSVNPTALDSRQRKILRSPQGIYLWKSLYESKKRPPAFRTMTDLSRAFWEMTREKLTELKPGAYEHALDALVQYMDRHGTLHAPRITVSRWPTEIDALLSLNVLAQGERNNLLFAHQSYLDHLTAERVLRDIYAGAGTVLGWLESDDQSLFRRAQLRQALAMLRDDDPEEYAGTLRSLLASGNVRFHLKHLVLQLLGHADPPTPTEVDLVLSLLADDPWLDHVYRQVLVGRGAWFDALHARGVFNSWLIDPDTKRVSLAIQLIDAVVESEGDAVDRLLADNGQADWHQKLAAVLWRHPPERLTPALFDSYVRLTRAGRLGGGMPLDWKALAASSPERCIDLLEATVLRELDMAPSTDADAAAIRTDRDLLLRNAFAEIRAAAASAPNRAWDKLAAPLNRLLADLRNLRRASRHGAFDPSRHAKERRLALLAGMLLKSLTGAGRALASTDPDQLSAHLENILHRRSKPLYRLAARCLAAGPDRWADDAIRWLLEAPGRLQCGRGHRGSQYAPARRLIRRFSGSCSDQVFGELLSAILTHRPEWEKRAFRTRHEILLGKSELFGRPGYDILTDNDLGLSQHVLLSALPKRRMTAPTLDWAGVLERKCGDVRPLLEAPSRGLGGLVTSTIPRDRLRHLSNRQWLAIVRGRWPHRPRSWRQIGPDQIGEASAETFAADLGEMAALQPQRFARLAVQIPHDADPLYAIRILRRIAETQPPNVKDRPTDWKPASVEEIENVVQHFQGLRDHPEFAMALCWAVGKRGDGTWSDPTLARIVELAATHPDPTSGDFAAFRWRQPSGDQFAQQQPDLLTSSINCVRGVAAEALQSLLFYRRDKIDLFRPAIDALIADPHPAVRVAALGLALPLWNLDQRDAVRAFLTACSHRDDAVLKSPDLGQFFQYAILRHTESFGPLLRRMLGSPVADVARAGAAWVSIIWAHTGAWRDEFDRCIHGHAAFRRGMAEALAFAVASNCDNQEAPDQLAALFNDPDKDVRAQAARFFRCNDAFAQQVTPRLAESFAASPAMDDNIDDLLFGLEHQNGDLSPFVSSLLTAVGRFAGPLASEARDIRTARPLHADMLAKVLLRLYDQSENDRQLRLRCLDAWDRLLFERVGFDILRHIDA